MSCKKLSQLVRELGPLLMTDGSTKLGPCLVSCEKLSKLVGELGPLNLSIIN